MPNTSWSNHTSFVKVQKTELFKGSQGDTSINPGDNNNAAKHYEKSIVKGLIIYLYLYIEEINQLSSLFSWDILTLKNDAHRSVPS